MKYTLLTSLIIAASFSASAQEKPLPEKVRVLKANYEAAVARATAPLSKTYVTELKRLKTDYTKSADLNAALAVEGLLKEFEAPTSAAPDLRLLLTKMTLDQFKQWLITVEIQEHGNRNVYGFSGTAITLRKPGQAQPIEYPDAKIDEVGRITVPFSAGKAVIEIDRRMKTATVTYTGGSGDTQSAEIVTKRR